MVDSLAKRQVDAFCVGGPWNSVAVELGVGVILHLGSDILSHAVEKLLTVRERWARDHAEVLQRLTRAHRRAAVFVEDANNRLEVAAILAAPDRIGVDAEVIARTLAGRIKLSARGTMRASDRFLLLGRHGSARPDPVQAAWLYAQMVRWRQAPLSAELLAAARAVFRPNLFDAALAGEPAESVDASADGVGAFTGPAFDANDIAGYLAAWASKRHG
jgi:NitT/TauT family transport system ATP-binding protein